MKPYILWYTSIIGVEITVTPLIFGAGSTFLIIPIVINTDRHYILLSIFNIRSQIETYSHRTIFMQADIFAIDIKISSLTDPFKFNKDFFFLLPAGRRKCLRYHITVSVNCSILKRKASSSLKGRGNVTFFQSAS